MQDIRIFIEAAVAKIRGVFPYTACQSKTVAQSPPGTRGAPSGGVSGAKRGVFLPGSGHFPGAFKVMRPWLSQGKIRLGGRRGRLPARALTIPQRRYDAWHRFRPSGS